MPRELTARETALWWDRLTHADTVWKDAGLSEESDPACDIRRWFDYYRGEQAAGIGFRGIDASFGVIENVFFSTINGLMSSLFARNPRIDIIADAPERKTAAESFERVVNHLIGAPALRIRREINRILLDALLGNFGVARHGFTLSQEKHDAQGRLLEIYDSIRPEFPWIRRIAAWNFRCDPLGETLHPEHVAWCAFLDLYPIDVIRRSPAFIARDDLRPTHSSASLRDREKRRSESPDAFDLVAVWTLYDKVRRETFRLSRGSDKALSKAREWPIPWRTLPYDVLQFNPVPDDPMGVSFGSQIGPLQDDLNRAYTLAMELAKRQRRIIFVSDQLSEEEKEKLDALSLLEIVFCTDTSTVAREVQVGGNFQELLVLAQTIKNAIRGLVGVGEMERGQRINVETAAEATLVGQGSQLQRGRNQGPFEEFLADTIETFARGVQSTATQPLVVPILGTETTRDLFAAPAEGGISYAAVEPEAIQGEFQYRVRPGSTLPHDPNEELRREIALNGALAPFGELINAPQRAIDTLLAAEKDPAAQLMTAPQISQHAEQRANVLPGEGQAGGAPARGAAGPASGGAGGGGLDANLAKLIPMRGESA